jgi:hypothetical protein
MPELFPMTAYPDGPYAEPWLPQVTVLKGTAGTRQALRNGTRPLLVGAQLTYTEREASQLVAALRFWQARGGTLETFYFWTFNLYHPHIVGTVPITGDGSNRTFLVPLRELQTALLTTVVYLDGVAQSASDWTWSTAEATSPYRSTLLFGVGKAPANGKVVTVEACGRKLITAAFLNDAIRPTLTQGDFLSVSFGLEEVVE